MLDVFKESLLIQAVSNLHQNYGYGLAAVSRAYAYSYIGRLNHRVIETLRCWLGYSFLSRITEINISNRSSLLVESKAASWITKMYNYFQGKNTTYLEVSFTRMAARGLVNELCTRPMKVIGKVVIGIVLVNIVLFVLKQKDIGTYSWLLYAILLFAGIIGISCGAAWKDIKETSLVLRFYGKDQNSQNYSET